MKQPKLYFHEKVEGRLQVRKLAYGTLEQNLAFLKQINVCDKIVKATGMLPSGAVLTVVK